jgi:hypothetical protein
MRRFAAPAPQAKNRYDGALRNTVAATVPPIIGEST